MPIVFEQPAPMDAGISESVGRQQQIERDREYGLRLGSLRAAGGGGGGGHGAYFGPGNLGPPGEVNVFSEEIEDPVSAQLRLNQGRLNQVEVMRLQQLENGLAQIDQLEQDGMLDASEARDLRVQVQTGIDPLQRRMAQAQVAERQQRMNHLREQAQAEAQINRWRSDFMNGAMRPEGIAEAAARAATGDLGGAATSLQQAFHRPMPTYTGVDGREHPFFWGPDGRPVFPPERAEPQERPVINPDRALNEAIGLEERRVQALNRAAREQGQPENAAFDWANVQGNLDRIMQIGTQGQPNVRGGNRGGARPNQGRPNQGGQPSTPPLTGAVGDLANQAATAVSETSSRANVVPVSRMEQLPLQIQEANRELANINARIQQLPQGPERNRFRAAFERAADLFDEWGGDASNMPPAVRREYELAKSILREIPLPQAPRPSRPARPPSMYERELPPLYMGP